MLSISDVHKLITYCTVVESFFVTLSVSGLLYLRYKQPNITRPIKVHLAIPIIFVVICVFLLILPCFADPESVGFGALITATGVPVYYLGLKWKSKPQWFQNIMRKYFLLLFEMIMGPTETKNYTVL